MDHFWRDSNRESTGGNVGKLMALEEFMRDVRGDWDEVFEAAKLDPARIAGVERGHEDLGDYSEGSWMAFGKLTDGQWFIVTGWCDTTGWGCQDGGEYRTAATREDLIRLQMTSDERATLLDLVERAAEVDGVPVRPHVCVIENCPACDDDSDDEYVAGFRAGHAAARESFAKERASAINRENAAAAFERVTAAHLAEQEERHRRTLEVMDAEVARLTKALAEHTPKPPAETSKGHWPDLPGRRRIVLEIKPSDEPVRMLLLEKESPVYAPMDPEERLRHESYFYEEGTCPENWASLIVRFEVGHDHDPHGFVELVESISLPPLPDGPLWLCVGCQSGGHVPTPDRPCPERCEYCGALQDPNTDDGLSPSANLWNE